MTKTTEPEMESHSVTMAPAGTTELGEVSKSAFTIPVHYTSMIAALGHGDALDAMHNLPNFEGSYDKLLERLNGISVGWSNLYNPWDPDKEILYELGNGLYLADPAYVSIVSAWGTADIEEAQTEVVPWLGNSLSRSHSEPPADWVGQYQYYSLQDIFGKVAQVFREQERCEALSDVEAALDSTVSPSLSASDNRSQVVRIMTIPEPGTIWTFHMNGPGFIRSHMHPFDIPNILSDIEESSTIGPETLVKAGPEVALVGNAFVRSDDWRAVKNEFHNSPVVGEISAMKNGQVYPFGARYNGPIVNLS